MAGIGLATIFVHCIGGAFTLGFNVGFTAVSSRSYGANNKNKYKQCFRQGLTNLGIMLISFILLGLFSYRIIIFTGQS